METVFSDKNGESEEGHALRFNADLALLVPQAGNADLAVG